MRSYIICCSPRSGSHVLADGLSGTGLAGYPKERFSQFAERTSASPEQSRGRIIAASAEAPPYDKELDAAYIKEVLRIGTTDNGVFGVSIHWFQLPDAIMRVKAYLNTTEDAPEKVLPAAFPNLAYIWLRRNDKVAQAVSWYKAIESGQFLKVQGGATRETPNETLQFDFDKIRTYLSALTSYDNSWKHFFSSNGIQPLTISYEDLSLDYTKSIKAALDFIGGVDGPVVIRPTVFEKLADAQSAEWVQRYRRMSALR